MDGPSLRSGMLRRRFLKYSVQIGVVAILGTTTPACSLTKLISDSEAVTEESLDSKIVFSEYKYDPNASRGTGVGLWIVNPDGSDLKKIFEGVEQDSYDRINVSPDGRLIGLREEDSKGESQYLVIDRKGKILHRFGFQTLYVSGCDLEWTPDGKKILFSTLKPFDERAGVYSYSLESPPFWWPFRTSGIHTDNKYVYDHGATMSPDGKKIAFTHHEYSTKYWIYVMDSDGDNEKLIISGNSKHNEDFDMCWIDNKHIIWKVMDEKRVYCYDAEAMEGKELLYGESFSKIRLSPDRKTLSLLSGLPLRFMSLDNLGEREGRKPDLTPGKRIEEYFVFGSNRRPFAKYTPEIRNTGINADCMDFSPDGKYFVVGNGGGLSVYDRSGNQYSFLKDTDNPEKIGSIKDVRWLPEKLDNLGEIIKKQKTEASVEK